MEHMLETLKVKLVETFNTWESRIIKSEGKGIEVNMATEFSDILARNIVHICFGEDLSNEPIELTVLEDGVWKPKTMAIKDSIYIIVG